MGHASLAREAGRGRFGAEHVAGRAGTAETVALAVARAASNLLPSHAALAVLLVEFEAIPANDVERQASTVRSLGAAAAVVAPVVTRRSAASAVAVDRSRSNAGSVAVAAGTDSGGNQDTNCHNVVTSSVFTPTL
jgi:hypothetical protein